MEWWMWILAYIVTGIPVGLRYSREQFNVTMSGKTDNDPDYKDIHFDKNGDRRFGLELMEAAAADASKWGRVAGLLWPIQIIVWCFQYTGRYTKRVAGGKKLAEARRAKEQAEIDAKVAKYTAEATESWERMYGPDAPKREIA